MFRLAVFSIVLACVAAPEATLLCTLWCQSSAAATSECRHHPDRAARVTSDDSCEAAALNVRTLIRPDGVRTAAGSSTRDIVPVPRYRLAGPTIEPRTMRSAERTLTLERRPFDIALRL